METRAAIQPDQLLTADLPRATFALHRPWIIYWILGHKTICNGAKCNRSASRSLSVPGGLFRYIYGPVASWQTDDRTITIARKSELSIDRSAEE